MSNEPFRFTRPDDLTLVAKPKLSVAVVIACRDGQEKLDLVLASLTAQSYPASLTTVYVIDDGSAKPLVLPAIKPAKTKLISYKNSPGKWGKTAATNDCVARLKEDVLWFIDADMVFEPDHLAHHMKWHHDNDDYTVLGWKRFVKNWSYNPEALVTALKAGAFDLLHEESWGKDLWEERVARTEDLVKPALDGYRAFVGATFSIRNDQWRELGGYNRNLITGEDTELGWRIFTQGLRTVVDRQANSWHLGYSTVESSKEQIHRHNDPSLAQVIPQMHSIRAKSTFAWSVPTYQVFVDVRQTTLAQFLDMRAKLLALPGTNAHFTLLGPWKVLSKRYSPVGDIHVDLREIRNWLQGDVQYSFEEIAIDAQISVEEILESFTHGATPYYIFVESRMDIDLKDLVDYLLSSGQGLVGVADKADNRAFALFGPALGRALRVDGSLYKSISRQWGVLWISDDRFAVINQGKHNRLRRFARYIKREGKKVNSPKQLAIFIKKISSLVIRKALGRG
ncbi:MAG: glycosyltransferase [Candidatus Planktophila sp.]